RSGRKPRWPRVRDPEEGKARGQRFLAKASGRGGPQEGILSGSSQDGGASAPPGPGRGARGRPECPEQVIYFPLAIVLRALDLSVAVTTALMSMARKPRSSSSCTAEMVVPPGVVTWSLRVAGCWPVSFTSFAAP